MNAVRSEDTLAPPAVPCRAPSARGGDGPRSWQYIPGRSS
jgi:hypothetical protein